MRREISRRDALAWCANGFGLLALRGLLDTPPGSAPASLAARAPHFAPRCKRVIFLFMSGGPSHVDLFDPKPRLQELSGQPLPFEMPKLIRTKTGNLLGSPWKFAQHGEAGIAISELMPQLARHADDLCVIRSMVADNINHNGACLQMNTGEQAFSRPSMGSWLLYGLGTENQDLPGYVVLSPAQPAQGAPLWSSAFLPAAYQGTLVADLAHPIADLGNTRRTPARQRDDLDALHALNELHARRREADTRLDGRIESFELAFRMQAEAPAAFDVDAESAATKELYGLGDQITATFGRQCLLARRLVERGVRFVQVYHTETAHRKSCQLWDQHGSLRAELANNCAATDQPVAALLHDLKARGLLEETLVIWGGEFGRTPTAEGTDGREHHPFGFTMWLAGGGVKSGHVHGATDDFGWHAVQDKVHVHDLHATILHLLGLDHERLTYRHAGRDWRLTDVYGNVVDDLLGMSGVPPPAHVSTLPWSDERPETLLVCCSDGRFHPHLEEFASRRVSERPDMIALPGGPAAIDAWASSFDHARVFAESLDLLLASHDLRSLWLVAHEGCSYYRKKHPGLDATRLRERQLADLRRARELVHERRPGLEIHLIHASVRDGRVTFLELAPVPT